MAVGNFDGVHLGHRHVLVRASHLARSIGGEKPLPVLAVTFDPHPTRVFAPERAPARLTSTERRVALLHSAGADDVFVLAFDQEIAAWSPEHFVDRVLVDELCAQGVVVGENFRFGAKASGDVDLLRRCGERHGFTAVGLELDGEEQPWSSTLVRGLVADGDVAAAAHALGRFHSIGGVVGKGDRRGRAMGFPTANVPASSELAVPADGVYAGWLRRDDGGDDDTMPAAISVGTNPTFNGASRQVEAYVLDRDDLDLYGVPVEVVFADRIRGQVQFTGADDLVAQMHRDVEATRDLLSRAGAA